MNELFANPAIQAGLAPFLAALMVSAPLRRTRLLGLAITVAFAMVIALTIGFSFESLTSVRKLVIVGLAASVATLVLDMTTSGRPRVVTAALAAAAAGAAVWVVLRVLQQQAAAPALLAGTGAALYLAALVGSTRHIGADSVRAAACASLLGLGSGALALLGASALLAQIGIAIGAGAGATLLVQMLAGRPAPVGSTLALTASVVAGLVGLLAVFTGSLPWYCLLPTLAVPWIARLVPGGERPLWLTAIITAFMALIPMLLAVGLAWFTAGAST